MGTCYRNRDKSLIKHECLRFEELPKPGTLVAIDAEFVSMQQVGSHSTRLVRLFERVFLFHRKKQSSGPTGRTVSFAQLASVLHEFLSCEGTARKKGFRSSTTTSIRVMLSSIISPSSRASNVGSQFPLLVSLRRTLGTARSRRLGSALVKAHVDTAEACIQEATITRRSRMHIYRPRTFQGFPDNQSVPSLSVTPKVHSRPCDRRFRPT